MCALSAKPQLALARGARERGEVGRGGEEDVLRLQIAMDGALLVREGEALEGLEDEGAGQL